MNPATIKVFEQNPEIICCDTYKVGRRFDHRKARIADLCDACLWVFVRWGYRVVEIPAFDWVGQATKDGKAACNKWAINLSDPYTKATQEKVGKAIICPLNQPSGALLNCHKESGIILPTIFNHDPYQQLEEDKATLEIAQVAEPVLEFMNMGVDFSGHHFTK